MRILAFLIRRTLLAALLLCALSLAAFAILEGGSPALPAPDRLAEAYGGFVLALLRGELAPSVLHGAPALALVAERLPATLALMLPAGLTAGLLALPLGLHAAARPRAPLAGLLGTLAALSAALPPFLLALLFADGAGGGAPPAATLAAAMLALALPALAILLRRVRTALGREFRREHLRVARARGIPPPLLRRHALAGALPGLLREAGLLAGALLAATLFVERAAGWPGAGALLLEAARAGDAPVLAAFVLVAGTLVLALRTALDLAALLLEPGPPAHGGARP
jgi:peptide/nickel transport system permease protein